MYLTPAIFFCLKINKLNYSILKYNSFQLISSKTFILNILSFVTFIKESIKYQNKLFKKIPQDYCFRFWFEK